MFETFHNPSSSKALRPLAGLLFVLRNVLWLAVVLLTCLLQLLVLFFLTATVLDLVLNGLSVLLQEVMLLAVLKNVR